VKGQVLSPRARVRIGATLIAAAAAAAYANSFGGAFQFDDIPAIVDNPTLHHLWPPSAPLTPPTGALTVSGRPLLNLSFALNYAISAYRTWSYHALNLAIHIAAALTLFGIVRRTLADRDEPLRRGVAADGKALVIALIWAVHPLTSESVTYIVQRAESLASLLYLLTLYGFIRSSRAGALQASAGGKQDVRPRGGGRIGRPEEGGAGQARSGLWLGLSVGACLLGTAVKEIVVSAPLAVLLYDRTFVAGGWASAWKARKTYYLCLAATWLPLVGMVASTGWNRGATSGFGVGISPLSYWLTQGEAMIRYLGLCFWPHPLAIDYGPTFAPRWLECVLCALVFAAFLGTAAGAVRGRPWAFLASLCFVILAPTSVIPGILQFVAEHRMYLPLAAVVSGAVLSIDVAARWFPAGRAKTTVLMGLLAVVLSGLGIATANRNRDYQDDLVLWLDDIAHRPQSALSQANVGQALLTRGRVAEAIPYCVQALVLDPMKPTPHYNLGLAYEHIDRLADAVREFALAAWINPKMVQAKYREGLLLTRLKRPAEAEPILREALAAEPEFAGARASLGVALSAEGRAREAIAEFEHSLRLDPRQPDVEFDLAIALASLGQVEEAMSHDSAAIRLRPDYGEARLNRGVFTAQSGKFAEALPDLEAASRLLPGSAEAHANLATDLDQMGRTPEAIAEYRRALQIRPSYPEAHYNLGNALLKNHDLAGARAEFLETLRLKPDFGAAREMLDRLALYPGGP